MNRRVRTHVNPLSITREFSFVGFPNDNPIIVDVGACHGEFTAALAEKFPRKNIIAFEIRHKLLERLQAKFENTPNVICFGGDAGRNFHNILKSSLERGVPIEQIFVNFPDPWFKESHKKRRFINAKFLEKSAEFLPAETEFIFQTDQLGLFNETKEVLAESVFSRFEDFAQSPYEIQTHWEKTKISEGADIYRMKFWKMKH